MSDIVKTYDEEVEEFNKLATEITEKVLAEQYNFGRCATRLDRNGPYHVEDVVAALTEAKGNFAYAARLLARNRARLKDFVFRNPMILDFYNDLFEGTIDTIESNYLEKALYDMGIARHVLSTRARDRGWGEIKSVDLTSSDGSMGGKMAEAMDLSGFTDEELEEYERLTNKARHSAGEGEA